MILFFCHHCGNPDQRKQLRIPICRRCIYDQQITVELIRRILKRRLKPRQCPDCGDDFVLPHHQYCSACARRRYLEGERRQHFKSYPKVAPKRRQQELARIREKRRDPAYREYERKAVRERMRRLRAERTAVPVCWNDVKIAAKTSEQPAV